MPSAQFIHSVEANLAFWQQKTQELSTERITALTTEYLNLLRAAKYGHKLTETWRMTADLLLQCYDLIEYQGNLVIGFNTPDVALRRGAFGNVWAWNPRTERWLALCQPVEDADDALVKSQTMFNTSLVDRGHLVLGGGAPHALGMLGLLGFRRRQHLG